MAQPMSHIVPIEVFSAATFYQELAAHSPSPKGLYRSTLSIPHAGLVKAPQTSTSEPTSLVWIDGLYTQSVEVRELLHAIQRREIPRPIMSRFPRFMHSYCTHVSAYLIAESNQSILAATGFAEKVWHYALQSAHIQCRTCGRTLRRFTNPTLLLDTLSSDFSGREITVSVESTSTALPDWAASQGFTVRDTNGTQYSVILGTTTTAPDSLLDISSLIKSIWAVPGIVFRVVVESQHTLYAPHGWCDSCGRAEEPPTREGLLNVLKAGNPQKASVEAALMFAPDILVAELLTTPVQDLSLPTDHPLYTPRQCLISCGLADCTFGTQPRDLSSTQIARLTVALSIAQAPHQNEAIILDLPRGTLADSHAASVLEQLNQAATSRAVILLGDPLTEARQHERNISFAPHLGASSTGHGDTTLGTLVVESPNGASTTRVPLIAGETFRLQSNDYGVPNLFTRCVDDLTGDQNQAARPILRIEGVAIAPRCECIPLFICARNRSQLLGDELGIMEKLAQLYAQSLDARMAGLSPKDFLISSPRSNKYLCGGCKGLGVALRRIQGSPRPHAAPCPTCQGLRFKAPVATTLFKGVSFSEILHQPLTVSAATLSSLANAKEGIELAHTLGLQHLPLGMPVALLSPSELRRVAIIKALRGAAATRPTLIFVQEPCLGFSSEERAALDTIQREHPRARQSCWIEVV
jgi:ABC-type lipoprotein export system ATPase subunit